MVTCSAPGKVYLFGEHAVVYGEPAIACAINLRISTSAKLLSSGKIRINAMGKHLNCMSEEFKYACCAAQTIKRLFNTDFGAEITIKSQLPARQGLGSSAAVTVSTIKALAECLGIEPSIGEITRLGIQKLAEDDFVGLGELMNVNQGLLETIGVSDEALSRLIYASRTAGALGAKITGAGRGGCMLAITHDENVKKVSQAIEKYDANVLNTAFSDSGLQIE